MIDQKFDALPFQNVNEDLTNFFVQKLGKSFGPLDNRNFAAESLVDRSNLNAHNASAVDSQSFRNLFLCQCAMAGANILFIEGKTHLGRQRIWFRAGCDDKLVSCDDRFPTVCSLDIHLSR